MKHRLLPAAVLAAVIVVAPAPTASGLFAENSIDVLDNEFNPKVSTAPDNAAPWGFRWYWGGQADVANQHNVVQNKGLFRSGAPTDDTTKQFVRIVSAGRYPYHCQVHGGQGMTGKLRVAPSETLIAPEEVRVRWANADSNTGNRFDVQFRVNDGRWRNWLKNTKKFSKVFGRNNNPVNVNTSKEYDVRARSQRRRNEEKRSQWSPPETLGFDPN